MWVKICLGVILKTPIIFSTFHVIENIHSKIKLNFPEVNKMSDTHLK